MYLDKILRRNKTMYHSQTALLSEDEPCSWSAIGRMFSVQTFTNCLGRFAQVTRKDTSCWTL